MNYVAPLNQRQQVSFLVPGPFSFYGPTLATATWYCQVRDVAGNLLLSSANGTSTYFTGVITFQWPQSIVESLLPQLGWYDFTFSIPNVNPLLPASDPEVAGFGKVEFVPGITQIPPPTGAPAPPVGADDTWMPIGVNSPYPFLTLASLLQASLNPQNVLSSLPNVQKGAPIPPTGNFFVNSSGYVVIAQ